MMFDTVLACLAQSADQKSITLANCYSALENFQWDSTNILKDTKNDIRKTCGDCKIRLAVFTAPTDSPSARLKGVKKAEMTTFLDNVGQTCAGPSTGLIREGIWSGPRNEQGQLTVVLIERGDMKAGSCSGTRKQP
ncbi:hypothetical protein CROQUDRAFT_670428 [Cronartium quercuum f. sp. fusiforme G11]|uniref:Uncharacterized protein n=1 Tax=Cronartium quercuum f. sp. fusiforme G11 TaxID=708437 RepID=A0A9P6TEF8_9BASI|nr:hypothetical protein CROQUDRAFT_670428 [Cronartium quercuum f. sp. fusiforme G11]